MDIDNSILGRRIQFFRKRAGMTQFDLELATGFASGVISRIEGGKTSPTKESVLKIAKVLNLSIMELEYLIGIIVYPATDEEVKLARAEVAELFEQPNVVAYMLDDRLRLIEASKAFFGFLNIDPKLKDLFYMKSIVELALSSNSPMNSYLDPESKEELARNLIIRIYSENSFMFDDPRYIEIIKFINKDPFLASIWKEATSMSRDKMVVHLSHQRTVKFIADGKIIQGMYSIEPLQKYPRFQIADYVFI